MFTITIVETRTLTFPIEATSQSEALSIALDEYHCNRCNLQDEDWKLESTCIDISCK